MRAWILFCTCSKPHHHILAHFASDWRASLVENEIKIGPRLSAFSFIIPANWKFKFLHDAALSCQCSIASTISPILFSLDSELAIDTFFLCFALDVTANCICEIHCISHDGFDFNTVNKLSCLTINSSRVSTYHPNRQLRLVQFDGGIALDSMSIASQEKVPQ